MNPYLLIAVVMGIFIAGILVGAYFCNEDD